MTTALDLQIATLKWVDEHLGVVLLGLKARGVMESQEVDRLLQGIAGLNGTLSWLQRNETAIKQALRGDNGHEQLRQGGTPAGF